MNCWWATRHLDGGLENVCKKFKCCAYASQHSTKSYVQSCNQHHLQMRNEQALTTEKVIHQSSKLKPNKIKLDADERLGLRSLKEKKRTDTFMFTIFEIYPWGYGYTFCKTDLNKAGICLIRWGQLQCHRDTWASSLDSLRIKWEKKGIFKPLFDSSVMTRWIDHSPWF